MTLSDKDIYISPLGIGEEGRGVGIEGKKLSLRKRRKVVLVLALFLTIQKYFNWEKIKLAFPELTLLCLW